MIAGRTGKLVLENLLEDPRFDPLALVRSESSGKKLMKSVEGCGLERIVVCDVTRLKNSETPPPVEGIESMIICTSAVPVVSKRSLVSVLLRIPLNLVRRKKLVDFRALRFRFKANQYPEIDKERVFFWSCTRVNKNLKAFQLDYSIEKLG